MKAGNMKTKFEDLAIQPEILRAIEELGFDEPTEVQRLAIPPVLDKRDLIVMAKTGSGKTAAFGIPILQQVDPSAPGPQALILTPTRELAVQVDSDLKAYSKHLSLRTTAVYGQHSVNVEIEALKKGVSVVTGTPGRVYDHIRQGELTTKHIRFLVLDEADRMLDMGFIDQVVRIIKTLPSNRVTLLFSATMPPEVRRICQQYMKTPDTIEIESDTKTVDSINQVYCRVEKNDKRNQLHRILTVEQPDSCMIFCNTRAAVDRVQEFLHRKGYASQALHGDIPQGRRLKTIQQFKKSDFHMLVATDVAARGIHVEELSLVINYDVPNEKDSYVHRIGRTGRAGSGGKAITLVSSDEIISLYEIEEHIGAMIAEGDLPTDTDFADATASAAEKWGRARISRHVEKTDHFKKASDPRHRSANAPKHDKKTVVQEEKPRIRKAPPAEASMKLKPVQHLKLNEQEGEKTVTVQRTVRASVKSSNAAERLENPQSHTTVKENAPQSLLRRVLNIFSGR